MIKKYNDFFGLGEGLTVEKLLFNGWIVYCLAILGINIWVIWAM